MINSILWFIIVMLCIGFWLQHRTIGKLIKINEENEQMILDGVWLLKKHLVETHKRSFAETHDAEEADIIG